MNILSKLAVPIVVTVATMTVCFVGISAELTYATQSARGNGTAQHFPDTELLAALNPAF
jgi:hypothetical protein